MVDFIYSLFKSEETKIDEEYKYYKEKYGDKIKVFRKGDWYAIDVSFRYKLKVPLTFNLREIDYKVVYIRFCKEYEEDLKPVIEV